MTSSRLVWDSMREPAPASLAFLGISQKPGLRWVKATDSKVGLAIDLPAGFEFSPGKPFRNLDFEIVKLGASVDKSVFCVFCQDPGSFEIFQDLCFNLVKGLDGIDDPLARAKTTIARAQAWSELFKAGRRELTPEQILGLICELEFLDTHWLTFHQGVETWFGPDRKSQDFVDLTTNVAVEIKHMDTSNSISVSSIHQLQFDGKLFLVAYRLKEDATGKSLNEYVEQLLNQLEPVARADFESKLLRVGYEKRPSYEERFVVMKKSIYEVVSDFPRIIPGTLHGLVRASYTLELDSSFDEFGVSIENIGEAIER